MNQNAKNIVVFDDDPDVTDHLAIVLTDLGHHVEKVCDFEALRCHLAQKIPDLILLDLIMPGTDGVETLRFLASTGFNGQLLLVSGAEPEVVAAAQALGELQGLIVAGTLPKPYEVTELRAMVQSALKREADRKMPVNSLVERDVRTLVESGFLQVYYQPKRCLQTGTVAGFEALARCWHPEFGMLKPASFLHVVERSPLLERLTAEVIAITLRDMQVWKTRGHRLRVAINLAARSLANLGLPDKLRTLAKRHDIAMEDLTVEVTETTLASERVATLDVLTRLRIMGVGLAIDDFGSGYSNESRLARMPFNELKIDRSLIASMNDPMSLGHITRCLELCSTLTLTSVAEGVENEEQYQRLTELGIDEAQGYYIAKPMPSNAVIEWMEHQEADRHSQSA